VTTDYQVSARRRMKSHLHSATIDPRDTASQRHTTRPDEGHSRCDAVTSARPSDYTISIRCQSTVSATHTGICIL